MLFLSRHKEIACALDPVAYIHHYIIHFGGFCQHLSASHLAKKTNSAKCRETAVASASDL